MNRNPMDCTAPGSLERAIVIATSAHAGATDKAGAPYILHPLRVMGAVDGLLAKTVAVLHDVVEDSPAWTFDALRAEGFGDPVLQALAAVTKRPEDEPEPGETHERAVERYLAFVRRAAAHPVGRVVKRADLDDNLDIRRLTSLTDKDRSRLDRYLAARRLIDQLIGEGPCTT